MDTKIFILSGPAGAGKTTLLNKIFAKTIIKKKIVRAISFTTRNIRLQEKEGKDYFFVSKEKFLALKGEKFFLESQKVLDNYYGTPKYFYTRAKKEKKDLMLCIDVKGGMYLKKKLKVDTIISIFISVKDRLELYRRLEMRVEKIDLIKKRLALAKKELQFSKFYDYVIVNHDLNTSLKTLETILLSR